MSFAKWRDLAVENARLSLLSSMTIEIGYPIYGISYSFISYPSLKLLSMPLIQAQNAVYVMGRSL
jgi:hypothetical protein